MEYNIKKLLLPCHAVPCSASFHLIINVEEEEEEGGAWLEELDVPAALVEIIKSFKKRIQILISSSSCIRWTHGGRKKSLRLFIFIFYTFACVRKS